MKHTSQGHTPRVIVHRCSYAYTHRYADGSKVVTLCPVQLSASGRCVLHNTTTRDAGPSMTERLSLYRSEKAYD